jgi:small subunit ribosomal protein S6
MENTDSTKKNYELGFHISPNIAEAQAVKIKETLEETITSNDGVISFSKLPEKTRLSYLIDHERFSYFSYIQFSATDTAVFDILKEQIRLNADIMRFIILKLESDAQKKKTAAKKSEHKERKERKVRKPKEESVGEDTKEMEKQLEEIIGGI